MVVLGHPVVALHRPAHRPAVQAAHLVRLAALAHPLVLLAAQALQVAHQAVLQRALQLVRPGGIAH